VADSNQARDPQVSCSESYSSEADSGACVVAIDPGRVKCGLAIVKRTGETLYRAVVNTAGITDELARLISAYRPREVIIGDGTGSKTVLAAIGSALDTPMSIRSVPEDYTSEEARKRFVKETKPKGLQRLLPLSLRTPYLPYDDYVAVILGERYWRANQFKSENAPHNLQ